MIINKFLPIDNGVTLKLWKELWCNSYLSNLFGTCWGLLEGDPEQPEDNGMILIGWSSPHCATDFVVQPQLPFFHQQTVDKIKIFRYFSIFVKSRNMKICDVIIDMICQFLVEYVYFFRSSKDAPLKESQKPQSRHNYFLINYCKWWIKKRLNLGSSLPNHTKCFQKILPVTMFICCPNLMTKWSTIYRIQWNTRLVTAVLRALLWS